MSVVQELGLEVLQRLDVIRRAEDAATSVRLARLARGERAQDVWPEYFPDLVEEMAEGEDLMNPDAVYDYSGVDWGGAADMERDAALLAQYMGRTDVTVEGAGVDDGGWV